jgi:hypothetical protein
MNDWQKKVLELEESLNSFKESTTERFVKTGEKFEAFVYRIEDLETRTIELESKINPTSCGNPEVSFIYEFISEFIFKVFKFIGGY